MPEQRPSWTIDRATRDHAFRQADAARWGLTADEFGVSLTTSAGRAFAEPAPSGRELERYVSGLHLADLALACACALGRDTAWDHFVTTHRPVLYRAADALEPGGGAREIADSLYGDLYGLGGAATEDRERRSLFRYFHGRSSLATWLRSVLAQRYVDAIRSRRRSEPLPDDEAALPSGPPVPIDPDRAMLTRAIETALRAAIDGLPPRDRLRLRSYYVSGLTLAQIGRLTGEHEATVSRHLTRTRRDLRTAMEEHLRATAHLDPAQISRALELAVEDPGTMDVQQIFEAAPERKEPARDRSR